MELAPPAETTPHLFESQSLASSIFLDHPNPLQAFPTNSSSFSTGKDVVPDPLAAAQQDHLPFYSAIEEESASDPSGWDSNAGTQLDWRILHWQFCQILKVYLKILDSLSNLSAHFSLHLTTILIAKWIRTLSNGWEMHVLIEWIEWMNDTFEWMAWWMKSLNEWRAWMNEELEWMNKRNEWMRWMKWKQGLRPWQWLKWLKLFTSMKHGNDIPRPLAIAMAHWM